MKKHILIMVIVFAALLLLPLAWKDKVTLDIAELTAEWYKSVINIFIIGLIGLFFERRIKAIEAQYQNRQKLHVLRCAVERILCSPQDVQTVKEEWENIRLSEHARKYDRLGQIDHFITTLNDNNKEQRFLSKEYTTHLETLKKMQDDLRQ